MSRTRHLPPLTGFSGIVRELRYHEASRQVLGAVLIVLYTVTAEPFASLVWLTLPLLILGTAIRFFASGFIMKNDALATEGPYALVRHPLYTGNILIILAFSLANGHLWGVPLALGFFWFYYPTAIEYEDRKLQRLFGEAWEHWARATPALVPAGWHAAALAGRWSLLKSLRQNGEPLIALFVLVCYVLVVRQIA